MKNCNSCSTVEQWCTLERSCKGNWGAELNFCIPPSLVKTNGVKCQVVNGILWPTKGVRLDATRSGPKEEEEGGGRCLWKCLPVRLVRLTRPSLPKEMSPSGYCQLYCCKTPQSTWYDCNAQRYASECTHAPMRARSAHTHSAPQSGTSLQTSGSLFATAWHRCVVSKCPFNSVSSWCKLALLRASWGVPSGGGGPISALLRSVRPLRRSSRLLPTIQVIPSGECLFLKWHIYVENTDSFHNTCQ